MILDMSINKIMQPRATGDFAVRDFHPESSSSLSMRRWQWLCCQAQQILRRIHLQSTCWKREMSTYIHIWYTHKLAIPYGLAQLLTGWLISDFLPKLLIYTRVHHGPPRFTSGYNFRGPIAQQKSQIPSKPGHLVASQSNTICNQNRNVQTCGKTLHVQILGFWMVGA